MNTNRCRWIRLYPWIVLATLAVGVARAASPADAAPSVEPSQVIAQAAPTPSRTADPVIYPAREARVRAAAAQGPEALRRYIQRTRMIWNFYYPDYALW